MQAVLEKKSNLLFGKFASFFKSFSSKFPLVITSRKKIEELADAQDEIQRLNKTLLDQQAHLLGLNIDLEGTYAALHSAQDEVAALETQVQPKDELIEELRSNIETLNTEVEDLNHVVTALEIDLDEAVGKFLDSHNLRSLKTEWLLRHVDGVELDAGVFDGLNVEQTVVKVANRLVHDNLNDLTVEDIAWIKGWAEGKVGWHADYLRFPSRIVVNLSDDLMSQVRQILARIDAEKLSSQERCERIKEIIIQDPDCLTEDEGMTEEECEYTEPLKNLPFGIELTDEQLALIDRFDKSSSFKCR